MQAIIWWSVPLVAFVLAIAWVSVANRERPPVDPHDSVAEHQRFREAMGRQVGQPPVGEEAPPPATGTRGEDGPERPAGDSRARP
jgi:hypothetical protein